MEAKDRRKRMAGKQRIVVKLGTTTLTYPGTGSLNLQKMEKLVRILTDLVNQGKEVVVVSSGAIAVGRKALGIEERPTEISLRQACASVGQARLMMVYQKLFAEYNQMISQVLITKYTMTNPKSRVNAQNTFRELLGLGVIPIVNENDTVSVDEIEFGDNDALSAIVAALVGADLLILMSDIDGLYTDDPHVNPDARLIHLVRTIDRNLERMGKSTSGSFGTGGMAAKIAAAKIAMRAGADMVVANGSHMENIARILEGEEVGTLFLAQGGAAGTMDTAVGALAKEKRGRKGGPHGSEAKARRKKLPPWRGKDGKGRAGGTGHGDGEGHRED